MPDTSVSINRLTALNGWAQDQPSQARTTTSVAVVNVKSSVTLTPMPLAAV